MFGVQVFSPGPVFVFHGNAGSFWIFWKWNSGEWQLGCCILLFLVRYVYCIFSSGFGHVLGLRIVASGAAMIGKFKLMIADAVFFVSSSAAAASLVGSSAAPAAATLRVDVEKGPQAAAAHAYVVASSQVPSRCLSQKHPVFLFDKVDEEREEKKVREDEGDTDLLVRGLQGNTMVVRCGSGWTALDLSASLRCRTSVPVRDC